MVKNDRCAICGKLGGMGITRGTSAGHILCYVCADKMVEFKVIVEDSDNLLYDIVSGSSHRLTIYLEARKTSSIF